MQIYENTAVVFETDEPSLILNNVKKSHLLRKQADKHELMVHWDLKTVHKIIEIGGPALPSPIRRDYAWTGKHQPFQHQRETAEFLTAYKRAFCFNEQGTGKTASVIWACDYLMNMGLINRVLVICPLSIMKSAWQGDLFTFAMHRSCSVAHGAAKSRKKVIEAGAEFVIINYDGVAIVEQEIINGGFDMIVIDEGTAYKNATTNRWKILKRITNALNLQWLWILTGTPAAQSPLDAYGLARLLESPTCPKSFASFRDRVMIKIKQFVWVPKPHAQNVVHEILQPAIRFEKKDCLDLPAVTYVDRIAQLTPQQTKYYKALQKELMITAAGEHVSAVNAATKINKLLQISGGAVYTDDGHTLEFDVKNRLEVIKEIIDEASNKVLVFVPFTHTITLLEEFLSKHKISCAVINGSVSVDKRATRITQFQTEADPRVLLIQPQAASHGLTLTAADTIIWYAPVTSVETYLQANARIDRPGQNNPMTVFHIKGSPVENKLYAMLHGKVHNHNEIINLYRDAMADTVFDLE